MVQCILLKNHLIKVSSVPVIENHGCRIRPRVLRRALVALRRHSYRRGGTQCSYCRSDPTTPATRAPMYSTAMSNNIEQLCLFIGEVLRFGTVSDAYPDLKGLIDG